MIKYDWIRSNRKTMSIQIKTDGKVIVRTPYGISKYQVQMFIEEKKQWIEKHLKEISERQMSNKILSEEERLKGVQKALCVIPERVEYFAEMMNVTYGRITIREQKTRWGSCSSEKNLNFNWKLILAPPEVLDYVVVHELCHRLEMNHSPRFWAQVERVLPDYKVSRKWLREHGNELMDLNP